jgi:hypothetical protein
LMHFQYVKVRQPGSSPEITCEPDAIYTSPLKLSPQM